MVTTRASRRSQATAASTANTKRHNDVVCDPPAFPYTTRVWLGVLSLIFLFIQFHIANDPELADQLHDGASFGPPRPARPPPPPPAPVYAAADLHEDGGGADALLSGRGRRAAHAVARCTREALVRLRGTAVARNLAAWSWARGSSGVDWCEGNYQTSQYIAEFYNTISNVPFFVLPPIAVWKYSRFSTRVDAGINVVFLLLTIIGAGSGYFHATLSLSGQLFDEWAIIWVGGAAIALWTPPARWPALAKGSHFRFKAVMFAATALATLLSMAWPTVNAFILIGCAGPIAAGVAREVRALPQHDPRSASATRLATASAVWWTLAILCWVNDRVFCEFWKKALNPSLRGNGVARERLLGGDDDVEGITYPQLHAMWHVFVVCGTYSVVTVAAYAHALREAPRARPRLHYWPRELLQWGLPYVAVD